MSLSGNSGLTLPEGVPAGGTTGQQLIKLSDADFDVGWGAGNTDFIPGKVVANYAALPDPTLWPSYLAICQNSQGIWPINYKPKGIYYCDGATWTYEVDYVPALDETFVISADTAGNPAAANYVYLCDAALTFTLPTAVNNNNTYTIKRRGGSVTINTTGGQTIDGAASITIGTQYNSVTVVSDGSNWSQI